MWQKDVCAVVLAAGKSTRFTGTNSKLLTRFGGQEMVLYSLKLLEGLNLAKTYVVGHQKDLLTKLLQKHCLQPINFAVQEEQLGTGHAVACSANYWSGEQVLVLNGDMPLLQPELLQELFQCHQTTNASVSFVGFCATDPFGYGRVIINDSKIKIVEQKDATPSEQACLMVNAGVYLFCRQFLVNNLPRLEINNAAKELYLTDLIDLACRQKRTVNFVTGPEWQLLGINTNSEFFIAERFLYSPHVQAETLQAAQQRVKQQL